MKKTVAIFIAFFVIAMGTMVGWGFIDKQMKENSSPPEGQSPPNPSDSTTNTNTSVVDPSVNAVSPATDKQYTLSELAGHKKASDCWIAISGNVYDVTNYLDYHPGGSDMILMVCGQDATQAYNTQGGRGRGHSSSAKAQLANYKIGVLK